MSQRAKTKNIAAFVEYHIKDEAKKHESFLEDTPDFLRHIEQLNKEIDYTNKEKYPDRIFATGHYIRDFHYIQKQRIFTLHHGAIQDIYKEQQADKAEIAELKNELKEMKTMLNALKSHLGL